MRPLDAHAHVDPNIDTRSLIELDACVIAVTRSPGEYESTLERRDSSTLWALGVHPALATSHDPIILRQFLSLFERAQVIGEVGMDSRASVPLTVQAQTFVEILKANRDAPRIISVHSRGARGAVLDAISEYGGHGLILHWWLGSLAETRRAIQLGCSFSVNPAQVRNLALLQMLPEDRVMTETDHPFGNMAPRGTLTPGDVSPVERQLAAIWRCDLESVRRRVWRNFKELSTSVGIADSLPRGFLLEMLSA